jgi:cupin fold WbuC family metalloprotein
MRLVPISDALLHELLERARTSARGRVNHNLHAPQDVVQRMINAMQPGSYVTPHKHENPDKVELICPLIGRTAAFEFDEAGQVIAQYLLDANGPLRAVDIAPRTYHTFFALTPAALLEIIQGPYDAATHKKFAPWAPLEDDPGAAAYMQSLLGRL